MVKKWINTDGIWCQEFVRTLIDGRKTYHKLILMFKYHCPARGNKKRDGKKSTLFDCRGIYHESTNWEHYFYVSNWRRDRHFTWPRSSGPQEGLAACSKKGVPSFFSYLEDTEYWSVPGIKPATFRYAVKRSTDLTWDQAQFSFRFVITFRRSRRNENSR